MDVREKLRRILTEILKKDVVTPGEVVVATGLPRYEVLAAFHFLEALRVIKPVFMRGNYKVYTATHYARLLLEALNVENPLEYIASKLVKEVSEVGETSVEHIPVTPASAKSEAEAATG